MSHENKLRKIKNMTYGSKLLFKKYLKVKETSKH